MSIIHQLFRIKINCNIPIEVEEILIIYIKALQGKDKINNLFNIVGKVPPILKDYTVMNVKELRAEMDGILRPCDIDGTGKNGGIKKIDMINGLNKKHISYHQDENYDILKQDYIYNNKWFVKDKKLYNYDMLSVEDGKFNDMIRATEQHKYDKEIQEVKCLFDKLQQNSQFSSDLKRDMKRNCNITIKDIERGAVYEFGNKLRDHRKSFKRVTRFTRGSARDMEPRYRKKHPSIYLEYKKKSHSSAIWLV